MLSVSEYLETARWVNELAEDYDDAFTSDDYLRRISKELIDFWNRAGHLFAEEEIERGHIEHDFFLTRNGHGSGFWDGDYKEGDKLTEIAKSFGQDDGF